MMSEQSVANKEEAEKCRDVAKSCMMKGDYNKAARFLEKSLRLYLLPGVAELIAQCDKLLSSESSNNKKTWNESQPSSSKAGQQRGFTPEEQEAGAKKLLLVSKSSHHYDVLGVGKNASPDEIKKAYKQLALKFHPDKNSAPSAEAAFKAISTAFDCLNDPATRETYDQCFHESEEQLNQNQGHPDVFHGFRGQGFHQSSPCQPNYAQPQAQPQPQPQETESRTGEFKWEGVFNMGSNEKKKKIISTRR